MMTLDFNSPEPIYLQVANQIEGAIFTGGFSEEQQVPSTTEISKQFHINPATVLKGMNILVEAGLLNKKRGVGMFVAVGAQTTIRDHRRQEFYEHYVKQLTSEAKNLDLTEAEIIEMVKRGVEA